MPKQKSEVIPILAKFQQEKTVVQNKGNCDKTGGNLSDLKTQGKILSRLNDNSRWTGPPEIHLANKLAGCNRQPRQ